MRTLESYLSVRRAAGFLLKRCEVLLRSYAKYARRCGDTHVRAETAVAWASLGSSPDERSVRLATVARLARFARAEDARHEIPPARAFAHPHRRRMPYIFSAEDLRRLIGAVTKESSPGSLRTATFSALFALLAASGLRISEALALRLDRVTPEGLVIERTKFRKTRLVPLHPTAEVGLRRYLDVRRRLTGADDHVFLSQRRRGLSYLSAQRLFRRLVDQLGFRTAEGGRAHLHDLRHTFAVRALEACPPGRDQVARHILALSTFLGHGSLESTYWYLHATPRLMEDIATATERYVLGGVR